MCPTNYNKTINSEDRLLKRENFYRNARRSELVCAAILTFILIFQRRNIAAEELWVMGIIFGLIIVYPG